MQIDTLYISLLNAGISRTEGDINKSKQKFWTQNEGCIMSASIYNPITYYIFLRTP